MEENSTRSYKIDVAALTVCGPNRQENQDAIVLDGRITQKPILLSENFVNTVGPVSYAVIDGMGGYKGGSDAALLAASALSKYDLDSEQPEIVDAFCNALSTKILKAGYAWNTPQMGAAFAMLTLEKDKFTVANIGDCRVYRFEEDGFLTPLSIDDRLENGSGGITQSLGYIEENLDAHGYSDTLFECEQFLLCSDGVWGTLDEELLCESILENETAADVVNNIVRLCIKNNASDNCSVIFVKLEPAEEVFK